MATGSRYFDARIDLEGQRVLLRLTGELDLAAQDQVVTAFERAEATGLPVLVVDLEGLTYIDSCGVGTLVAAEHRARANHHRLSIANARGAVARVFALMELGRHLPLVAEPV